MAKDMDVDGISLSVGASMPALRVTHSTLCETALLPVLCRRYSIGAIGRCKLIQSGNSDTYRVEADAEQYILRIYRHGWRSESDVLFELDVLNHLSRHGVSVATPIPDVTGNALFSVSAPEGCRHAVLFEHAHGLSLGDLAGNHGAVSSSLGRETAKMHKALDVFKSRYPRFQLDIDHLLLRPLNILQEYLESDDLHYLQALVELIQEKSDKKLSCGSEYGVIHGDITHWNAHYSTEQGVTLYDFDGCGPGWRIYDLAVFLHENRLLNGRNDLSRAFLDGYQKERSLTEWEHAVLPFIMPIRSIWYLGLLAANQKDHGIAQLSKQSFIQHRMQFIRRLTDSLI